MLKVCVGEPLAKDKQNKVATNIFRLVFLLFKTLRQVIGAG
jgi:hypothetical protein